MSNSLVRASLELFGYENTLKQDKKKRRKNKSKGPLDLIPINHRVIGKTSKNEAITLKRSSKITVHEAKKRLQSKVDPTEENVKTLLLLSGSKIEPDTASKLFNRALKIDEPAKKTAEETTAFTEEDFENFEKEYLEL